MHSPGIKHWKVVKCILCYLFGTPNNEMFILKGNSYGKNTHMQLLGYSDSNWASDYDTQKSTSGNCFFLGDACISWLSKKQPTVATSPCEAEYRATFTATIDCVMLRRLLTDLCGVKRHPIPFLLIVTVLWYLEEIQYFVQEPSI